MTLASPAMLLLVPIYLGIEWYLYYKIRSASMHLASAAFLRKRETWRTRTMRVMRFLPVLAACLMIAALTRPKQIQTRTTFLPSGVDIVVALDASGSMAAEDFLPLNRLAVAKDVVKDFIRGRPSDRIGVVLFAGSSVTRSPLTLDHDPLIRSVETVAMGNLPEGTAIGSAIMSGINRLLGGKRTSSGGQRILVLLTDGRNNAGEIHPLDALSIAVKNGVKIYTIGVGSNGPVPFPVPTPDGKKAYRYERADLDEKLLREIADRTGGKYFRATDTRSLERLFGQINALEKSGPRTVHSQSVQDLSAYFIIPSFLFAFGYLLLTVLILRMP